MQQRLNYPSKDIIKAKKLNQNQYLMVNNCRGQTSFTKLKSRCIVERKIGKKATTKENKYWSKSEQKRELHCTSRTRRVSFLWVWIEKKELTLYCEVFRKNWCPWLSDGNITLKFLLDSDWLKIAMISRVLVKGRRVKKTHLTRTFSTAKIEDSTEWAPKTQDFAIKRS